MFMNMFYDSYRDSDYKLTLFFISHVSNSLFNRDSIHSTSINNFDVLLLSRMTSKLKFEIVLNSQYNV